MTELLWQSTLLLALAFFFGAVFACGLKRRYWYARASKQAARVAVSGVSHQPAPDQPKIEVAPRAAPEGERFGRAISGQSAPAAPAATSTASSVAAAMSAPVAARPKPAPAPARCRGTGSPGACRATAGATHFEYFGDDRFGRAGEGRRRRSRAER